MRNPETGGMSPETKLNNRERKMLEALNGEVESDYPLTEEGYNDAGRSAGVLEKIAKTEMGREAWKNYFLSISKEP